LLKSAVFSTVYAFKLVMGGNAPPTVATPASAVPNPVTGTTTTLSVLGADDGGEAGLTYTWSGNPGTVTFSPNGTNASKNSTATFSAAGSYTLTATIRDAGGLTTTSSVGVTVSQTLTTVTVTPSSASVAVGGTQQFTAAARDQFGNTMTATFTWTVSGGGTISGSGLFSATTVGGPFTATASSGAVSGTAGVTVTSGSPPTLPRRRRGSCGATGLETLLILGLLWLRKKVIR
jgi:hypothetical protein